MSSTSNASDTPNRSFWIPEELERIVQWLEEPNNESRFKKGVRTNEESCSGAPSEAVSKQDCEANIRQILQY